MKLSSREQNFFDKATIGGLAVEDAFAVVYSHRTKNILMTDLRRKRRNRPDIFQAIETYKGSIQANESLPGIPAFRERYARARDEPEDIDSKPVVIARGTWNKPARIIPKSNGPEEALEEVDFSSFLKEISKAK